jgi:hypothetical protein
MKPQKSLAQIAYEVNNPPSQFSVWQEVPPDQKPYYDRIARAVEREVLNRLRRQWPLLESIWQREAIKRRKK